MSKPHKKLKGRPATDERGNAIWKWAGETEVETGHLEALAEGLSLETPPRDAGLNPYSQPISPGEQQTKGRTLDEMKREHEALVKSLRKRTVRKAASQPTRGVRLQFGEREMRVDARHPRITIGRAEDNDVVVTRERVSRQHARIEVSRHMYVLTDQSTNGTFVHTSAGETSFTRRGSLQLQGQGMIGLGRQPRRGSSHTIHFICEES